MVNPKEYTILLAEDNDILRFEFKCQLKSRGFSVVEAINGKELYEKGKELRNLDNLVIVSDTEMPEIQGDDACESLLKEFPEYKKRIIIGMSDNSSNEEYWKGICVWASFILKGRDIAIMNSNSNLGKKVALTLNHIASNPQFYQEENGDYRRQM